MFNAKKYLEEFSKKSVSEIRNELRGTKAYYDMKPKTKKELIATLAENAKEILRRSARIANAAAARERKRETDKIKLSEYELYVALGAPLTEEDLEDLFLTEEEYKKKVVKRLVKTNEKKVKQAIKRDDGAIIVKSDRTNFIRLVEKAVKTFNLNTNKCSFALITKTADSTSERSVTYAFITSGGIYENYQHYDADSIEYIVTITPKPAKQDFKLKNGSMNCVIKALLQRLTLSKNKDSAKIKKKLLSLNEEYLNEGVDQAALNKIHKSTGCKVHVYNAAGLWFSSESKSTRLSVSVFADNNHASTYEPIVSIKKAFYYSSNDDLIAEYTKCEGARELVLDKNRIIAWRCRDEIHKTYEEPVKKYEFLSCTSEFSYEFKKFILDNKIEPLRGEYYYIAKAMNHPFASFAFRDFKNASNEYLECYEYDQVKAYPSFAKNALYPRFKLFVGNVNVFKNNDLQYVDNPGASKITNVVYKHPLIERMQFIRNDCWYTHIVLYFILSNDLATFDITETLVAKAEDLQFPFKPFTSTNIEDKLFNNKFIGRLIAGGHEQIITRNFMAYETGTRMQCFRQLIDEGYDIIPNVDMPEVFSASKKQENKSALFHIHAQIIDYQKVRLLTEMLSIKLDSIVAILTDAFFTTTEHTLVDCDGFKAKGKRLMDYKFTPATELKASSYDYKAYNAPDIKKYSEIVNGLNATNGVAGSGKTYMPVEAARLVNCAYLAPRLELVDDLKTKLIKRGCDEPFTATYHSYFDINEQRKIQLTKRHENIFLDEITMVPDKILKKIMKFCRDHRINLYVYGDFTVNKEQSTVAIFQRPPVEKLEGARITYETMSEFKIVSSEVNLEFTRQKGEDFELLCSIRGLSERKAFLKVIRSGRVRCISRDDFAKEITDLNFLGIAANHKTANALTKLAFNKLAVNDETLIPARRVKGSSKKCVRGATILLKKSKVFCDRVIGDREEQPTPKGFTYESALFRTSDSVQGKTFGINIYIAPSFITENFMYTALTRCGELSRVTFVINKKI